MARHARLGGEADRGVGGAEAPVAAPLHDLEAEAILERLGCEHGQGYLYSTPLTPDELLAYVAAGVAYLPTGRR